VEGMLRKIVLAMGFIMMAVLVYNWIQEWGSINQQLHWASGMGKGVHQKYGIWFILIASSTAMMALFLQKD
jgi:hypothetical protein